MPEPSGTSRRPRRRRPGSEPGRTGAPRPDLVEARRAATLTIEYPDLPVSERRDEIADTIEQHQVVVVAGETGSGKTTQLPKILLGLGRGIDGMIGHTQPRRIAARAVAERLAAETGVDLGTAIGYAVRFTDRTAPSTRVRVMTDGVLLAEISRDRDLRRYDTLIIDEAHERSLTIDFLLGYLTRLLPRRPDLKVVITSATIDVQRFSEHFGGAPVVEVSGRTYPVEVRYRPPDEGVDQVQAVCDALTEVVTEPDRGGPQDVLVFLSGEREIRDTADAVRGMRLPDTEVVPLYGRLSAAEQHRVFAPHDQRRVVLATNVAETSLTVPGIRYVIDAGTARISRYSLRTRVQRLPIEPVSQASANQRAGRCGRVADGVCLRLYSQDDFESRAEFTDPEVQRTNLASVILQMASLRLGAVEDFGFLDAPDRRQVRDGLALLAELGALDGDPTARDPRLTDLGRRLARLPLDPRLGRMVLEAERNSCVAEVLVVVAALSVQDPRERPGDAGEAAARSHSRFADETSDLVAYLNLWRYVGEQQDALSGSAFRRLCRSDFLHYLRVREWQDLVSQLRRSVRDMGIEVSSSPDARDRIHASLLAGLLSQVGVRDEQKRDYLGARGTHFAVAPGSALSRRSPAWVMAGEMVETSRLWAREVAAVEPAWVEAAAAHLLRRSYSEPHWSAKRGSAVAFERATLYGIPVVTQRAVALGSIDPETARDLFVRHALVEGDWRAPHAFLAANRALVAELTDVEDRLRRRDVLADDTGVYAFYDARIPAEVVSARHFDRWWKQARRETPHLLDMTEQDLLAGAVPGAHEYPDTFVVDGRALDVRYTFEPGADTDGVRVDVPLPLLRTLPPWAFDWQVPGARLDLVTAWLRSLPKHVRRTLVPVPDVARAALWSLREEVGTGPLLPALVAAVGASRGVDLRVEEFDAAKVPPHLRVLVEVTDEHGEVLGRGRELAALQSEMAPQVQRTLSAASRGLERHGLRAWTIGDLPRQVDTAVDGHPVTGYPALVDAGGSVEVRVLASEAEQADAMLGGTTRLLALVLPSPLRGLVAGMSSVDRLALAHNPYGDVPSLLDDCVDAALDAGVAGAGGPARDAAGFERLRADVGGRLADDVESVVADVVTVLRLWRSLLSALDGSSAAMEPVLADVRDQLDGLLPRGFVRVAGATRLPDVVRYLRAAQQRVDSAPGDLPRDADRSARVRALAGEVDEAASRLGYRHPAVVELGWMLQELRVSLFAQGLRTAQPISEKRVGRAIDALP